MTPEEHRRSRQILLDCQAQELGMTVRRLVGPGYDWMLIVWDGSDGVASESSVPHERLGEVLQRLRGPDPVKARIEAAERGASLESPLADCDAFIDDGEPSLKYSDPDEVPDELGEPTLAELNAARQLVRRELNKHHPGYGDTCIPDELGADDEDVTLVVRGFDDDIPF